MCQCHASINPALGAALDVRENASVRFDVVGHHAQPVVEHLYVELFVYPAAVWLLAAIAVSYTPYAIFVAMMMEHVMTICPYMRQ